MNRSPLMDRFGLRSKANSKRRIAHTRLGVEQLEERRLLSAYDILFSTFFDTHGSSVLRYSDTAQLPVPGGVATHVGGLGEAAGLAVAPDGSYYVSSDTTYNVLHFSNSGVFLGVLGAGDANPAQLAFPGTLAFGPNGKLYVADLGANAIFQFDTTSSTQQYLAADTFSLPAGFTPGGFTFAADSTHDLIVGSLEFQSVVRFHDGIATSTPVAANSGIYPAAILALSNGNLLIADTDFDHVATAHHEIVEYDAATGTTSQFINLTTPMDSSGDLPQPTSLLLDTDGNLLVGLSPDDYDDGAVEKFNIQTGALIGTIATGVGDPSGLALVPVAPSDIVFSTFFDTRGSSVLRYSDTTQLPVPGGVATLVGGLGEAAGLAVAPDGSYYVSSDTTYNVLHFSNSGVFLGVLGAGDANPVQLAFPGTLAFGPNGNLYVADLGANAIFQFDTTSSTQQYLAADTLSLPPGFTPGGFTFAADSTRDLIVGSLEFQSVVRFHDGIATSTPVAANSGIYPAAILALSNGNLLIADTDFDHVATAHHEIVEYDAVTGITSQFINWTTPMGPSGNLPQPTSLLLDTDGNLLVGLSPDDYDDGAVEKFDIQTGALIGTIATGVGDPSGLALVPQLSQMTVAATDWTNSGFAGLTLTRTADGMLHVYGTGTTTDVVPSQLINNVGEIRISGPDNAADALTIDFGGGSPIPPGGITFDGGSGSATNTVIISGSPDLSGAIQTTGSVTFGQGSPTNGAPSSSFTTTVTAGTLVVTSSTALPAGMALTVGAGGTSIFGASAVVQTPLAFSSNSPAVDVLPLATGGVFSSTPTVRANSAVDAPSQGQTLVPNFDEPSAAPPALPSAMSAALPPAQPAAAPSHVATGSLWRVHSRGTGPAIVPAPGPAGYPAWVGNSVQSSNTQDSTTEKNRRIAVLDAVLTQYGSP